MEYLFLATLPMAGASALILKLLDLTESGLAAVVLLGTFFFAGIWFLDPPEVGWGRRERKQRKPRRMA